jgi:hypothetical protein
MVRRVAAASGSADVVELPADPADAPPDDVVREDEAAASGLPKRAVLNPDGTVALPLRYPVTLRVQRGGETLREDVHEAITFHRMTGADLRAITAASGDAGVAVAVARSSRLSLPVAMKLFDRMDAADAADAAAVAGFFLGSGDRTGR